MPRRRCVGCGRIAAKAELVRIALAPQAEDRREASVRAVEDRDGTMPGRGAYLCRAGDGGPASACVALALRRRAIQRTLRAPVSVDPKIVESVSR